MNKSEEVWVKIKLNDRYEVSNYGNVRKKITRRRPYRYLKPETLQHGYKRVSITLNGTYKRFSVHRLVAMHFIPNPENLPFVMHLDNNPSNNYAVNLKWGTPSDNLKQAYSDNRTTKTGEANSISRFTNEDIIKIRQLYVEGNPQYKIAESYGVCNSHICMIVNRKIWNHI